MTIIKMNERRERNKGGITLELVERNECSANNVEHHSGEERTVGGKPRKLGGVLYGREDIIRKLDCREVDHTTYLFAEHRKYLVLISFSFLGNHITISRPFLCFCQTSFLWFAGTSIFHCYKSTSTFAPCLLQYKYLSNFICASFRRQSKLHSQR